MSKAKKPYTVPKAEAMGHRAAGLPELPGRHGDILESVAFGPRREMMLSIKPLMHAGNGGYYGLATTVRFGGIVNFDEVRALFKPKYCGESELNGIEYDQKQFSKSGDLHLLLSFERISVIIAIHCASLTVTD